MSFLLDTNALSELRKGPRGEPRVKEWATTAEAELHTSVVVLGEPKRGKDFADVGVGYLNPFESPV